MINKTVASVTFSLEMVRNGERLKTATRSDNVDVENWKVFNDDYLGMEDNSTVECLFTVQWYPRVVLVIMYEIILLLRGHAWPNFIRLCSSSLAETLAYVLSLGVYCKIFNESINNLVVWSQRGIVLFLIFFMYILTIKKE